MSSNAKLEQPLPCPFCGVAPVTLGSGEGQRGLMIHCITEDCPGPSVSYYNHRSAIAAWNRRTPARVLDAEKGGDWKEWAELDRFVEEAREAFLGHPSSGIFRAIGKKLSAMTTQPAQAAEAVERVARAIAAEDYVQGAPKWDGLHEGTRTDYTNMARAAIGAMGGGE